MAPERANLGLDAGQQAPLTEPTHRAASAARAESAEDDRDPPSIGGAPQRAGAPPAPALGDATPAPGIAAAAASGSTAGRAFEWPASTRVTFALTGHYRGEVSGHASVEWIRVGSRYQVHLDIVVGPGVAPLLTRRMTSDGDLTPEGLSPRRYDEDTQAVFRDRRRVTVRFEPDRVVLDQGEAHERWPGLQDTASQFIQMSFLFATRPELLRIGGSVEMPLALPRRVDRWIYDVAAEATVHAPFGVVETVHLKPRRSRPRPGELNAEIWFAPQLRYLPVRIRIEQDPQTWVDLVIERKPELAVR